MLAWVSRLLFLGATTWSARAYARDFVRDYIRRLVRERKVFTVHRFGNPLGGRLLGSALVWFLIAFNLARFVGSTLPDIMEARRYLAGPLGHVVRGMLGISIAKELVELELFVLAVCLLLGLYVRLGVSSTFQLLAPWRELFAIRW